MKMSSFIRLNLNLILFLMSFNKILNEACGTNVNLDGLSESEQKQKCFSLSHTADNNALCCLTKGTNKECSTTVSGNDCPKSNTDVPNNCGMAGVYEPQISSICKDISLVQGYCCYVGLKKNSDNSVSSACIRTKTLNKEKNEATDQIKNYVGNSYTITSVDCHGASIKYYWFLIIAAIMLL